MSRKIKASPYSELGFLDMTSSTASNNAGTLATQSPDPQEAYADWRENALDKRRQWMEIMGCDEAEIEEQCGPGKIADLDEEIANYNAAVRFGWVEPLAENPNDTTVGG